MPSLVSEEYFKEGLRAYVSKIDSVAAELVLFHGGGWFAGDPHQFDGQRSLFETEGIAVASMEYRVRQKHRTMVHDSIKDALDAAAYIRRRFPGSLLFFGGASVGWLLAVHCALAFQTHGAVLYNPVLDLSSEGFSSRAVPPVGDITISPLHMPFSQFPPTLIFHGTLDNVVPVAASRRFVDKIRSLDGDATHRVWPNAPHGFANKDPACTETGRESLEFIQKILRGDRGRNSRDSTR